MVGLLLLFFVFQNQFTLLLQSATDRVAQVISVVVGGNPLT
jgi:hypothetical protein